MDAAEVGAIKAQRELSDPHRLTPTRRGSTQFYIYCNVSQRTEGTVGMRGRQCSHCGHKVADMGKQFTDA